MTPDLVATISLLVKKGATVVGNPPVKSPSLVNYPLCDSLVKSIAENIWGKGEIPEDLTIREYGSGKILTGEKLKAGKLNTPGLKDSLNLYPDYQVTESLLNNAGIKPDFISSGNIRYTHRSLNDRDIYFISNRSDKVVTDTCWFREGTSDAELWNPVTAEINPINTKKERNGLTAVSVRLDASQSYFIVFYHDKKPVDYNSENHPVFDEPQTVQIIDGKWNVSFDTIWGGPAKVVFDTLTDWTKRPEKGIRFYSGTAVYSKSFDLPDDKSIKNEAQYYLDLGILKNLGRIKLNGHDLGILWTAPWQVNITGMLKEKDNELEVLVANLWINRLIGDELLPWDGITDGKWPEWLLKGTKRPTKRYTFTTHHYYRKDDPLSESGLIGPVSIKMETLKP
jgi:hypothetical protein